MADRGVRRVRRLALLLGLWGCTAAPEPLLRLEAHHLRFSPPARVRAGFTRIRLVNRDPVWHEASLLRFTDSSGTLEAYIAAAKAGNEYPGFARDIGGISFLAPGDSADALVNLTPGRYAVVCWHQDHVLQGMGAPFEVAGTAAAAPEVPAVDLPLSDFAVPSFTPVKPHQLLHLTNRGPSEHELAILRLEGSASLEDFLAWRAAGEVGTGPARTVAGSAALEPGADIWVDVPWSPGRYLLLCLLEDSGGTYHTTLGMHREIEVPE